MKKLVFSSIGLLALIAAVIAIAVTLQSRTSNVSLDPSSTTTTAPTEVDTHHEHEHAHDELPADPAAPNDRIEHTAVQLVRTMHSYEPATDASPQDAQARAARYTTGKLYDAALIPRDNFRPSPSWQLWAENNDHIGAAVEPISTTMESETAGTVRVEAIQFANALVRFAPFQVDVHLVLIDGVWLADSFEYVNGAPEI